MSTTYTSESTPINLTGEDNGEVNYQEVTTVDGEAESYTFSTEIRRVASDSTYVIIGTRNASGQINLNDDASDDEEKYLSTTLKTGLNSTSNDLVDKVAAGLSLTATERVKLKESVGIPATGEDLEAAAA